MNINNEILLILSIVIIYGGALFWYYLFGTKGLICWTVIATIAANIEVLITIEAFGMEQTLGNVMFGSTFLVTDILSEVAGKKKSKLAVKIGIATSITFIVLTQSWLMFTPGENDFAFESIQTIFSNIPRLMITSFVVYAITQQIDVWIYHKVWDITKNKTGDSRKLLWVRNNASTLISQFVNTVLFTFGAFLGDYDMSTLISIIIASYIIFIITSLIDTPVVYLARKIHDKKFFAFREAEEQ